VKDFGDLREQLGDMKAEAALAHALRSTSPDQWKSVPPQDILTLIRGILTWVRVTGFDPEVGPPDTVQTSALISSWNRVSLGNLLRWASFGLATEQKEKDFLIRLSARTI
jgi:hypothetical protein